jgi:hypothetical protein
MRVTKLDSFEVNDEVEYYLKFDDGEVVEGRGVIGDFDAPQTFVLVYDTEKNEEYTISAQENPDKEYVRHIGGPVEIRLTVDELRQLMKCILTSRQFCQGDEFIRSLMDSLCEANK